MSKSEQKYQISADRVMSRIETLASFSALESGVLRAFLTPEHKAAHQQLAQWMAEAGLETWQDEAGNQWGRKAAADPHAKSVILGSHSDTVVDAGKYDGTLGVILAIEALELLRGSDLPYHIDVVAFADEEGTRFNTTLLGSSAVAGKWQQHWLEVCDADGVSMAEAFTRFGLKPELIDNAARKAQDTLAYLEVHIEQGPLLESERLPVGVVTAIAGAKRYLCQVNGLAGHAGTVPIHLRQDAFCAVAEMALAIERYAQQHRLVATVGRCDIASSAVNVIPGCVDFSIDIRSQDQAQLEVACVELMVELQDIAVKRKVAFSNELVYQAHAVPCDAHLTQCWADVVTRVTGQPAKFLPSGAGHDAMVMATLTAIGMLFIRCDRGISHNPLESVITEDVAVGLECLVGMITTFEMREQ